MSNIRNDRKTIRRGEAEERAELRKKRTNAQQLEVLEVRGVTKGREITRLTAKIARGET